MTTRVIVVPEAIATPADVPGVHSSNDAVVIRAIAAAQGIIDGPNGNLGRAIGKQTLELWLAGFPCSRRAAIYGPLNGDLSVKYLDADETEQTISSDNYRVVGNEVLFRTGFAFPEVATAPDAVRIRYGAGYNTADVPPQAKQAVIMMALHAITVGSEKAFYRSEEVEGVGKTEYTLLDQAGSNINKIVDDLLRGLRVVRI
ncbi:hypothetical protein JNB71_03515 [Rhizobium herbae]|uniref:Phage tail protein n=1 Tax=Rhizobium herbae TaxID=508661 RepID=A0ABS7H5J3_9HYPH|nr:hypothetical protein [Rhizobium herbae]MBW9062380.1 hypothetical protein [Rhizobium herbae]